MKLFLRLAGLVLEIYSQRELVIEPEYNNFLCLPASPDVAAEVTWDWGQTILPSSAPLGEDALQRFYQEGDRFFCLTKAGPKGPIACTQYDASFQHFRCVINEKPFLMPPKALGSVLRMLPIRDIFLHFQTLFFHASQISHCGKAILFTAPSGTGKTTQAKLWQQFRDSEIVSNDRTLTNKRMGAWHTYGYPLDGSEPVRSSQVNRLGAIVLLEQQKINTVQRLGPSKALPRLMRQVVLDCWSGEARTAALELLMTLMEEIPVYLLSCTPDERAVEALETILMEDKVYG